MSQFQTQNLPQDKFLTVAANILHQSVLNADRTTAKSLFNALSQGQRAALTRVRMEDNSELRFELNLDHSEFRGKINYGCFKASLTQLLASLGSALQQEQEVPMFTAQESGNHLFGAPGVTEEDGQINVLLLGADMSTAGTVLLQLQYVDPEQFRGAAETDKA